MIDRIAQLREVYSISSDPNLFSVASAWLDKSSNANFKRISSLAAIESFEGYLDLNSARCPQRSVY